MDTFGTDTSVGGLTTEFELSLFAVRGALGTSCCTLMTGVARDTHPREELEYCSMIYCSLTSSVRVRWSIYLEVRSRVVELVVN